MQNPITTRRAPSRQVVSSGGVAIAALAISLWIPFSTGCTEQTRRFETEPKSESPSPEVTVVEEHAEDGSLRLRKEVVRLPSGDVVEHGSYTRYFGDGTIEYEARFVMGKKEGTTTQYHPNGAKWIEQTYHDGLIDGPSRTWDDQGRLRSEQHFKAGLPSGVWTDYHPDGSIKSQQDFSETTTSYP